MVFLIIAALPALWFGVPLLHRLLQAWVLDARCRRQGIVALTFDDGPGNRATPEILQLLNETSSRATFFVLGRNARLHPGITSRIIDGGHDLACHGDEHLDAWRVSPLRAVRDMKRGFESLSKWPGHSKLFRPVRGRITLFSWAWLLSHSVRIAWWTIDSGDTRSELVESRTIVDLLLRRGGGIVLLHDFDRSEVRERHVINLTKDLLMAARDHGLAVRPMSEILRKEPL